MGGSLPREKNESPSSCHCLGTGKGAKGTSHESHRSPAHHGYMSSVQISLQFYCIFTGPNKSTP